MSIDRILVPIDFSTESIKAYRLALDEFGGRGKSLVVVHVVDSVSSDVEDDPKIGMRFMRGLKPILLMSRPSIEGLQTPVIETNRNAPMSVGAQPADVRAPHTAFCPRSSDASIQRLFASPQVASG